MRGQLSGEDWGRLGRLDPPWGALTRAQVKTFAAELRAEVGEGHVLHRVRVQPIAVCAGSDDVLVYAPDLARPWAAVHLTWRGRAETPPWPATLLYAGLEDFCDGYQE